jgi:hypothetical protein
METLNRSVAGQIAKNESGRFEVYELELTTGCPLDVRFGNGWIAGQIAQDGMAYLFVSHDEQFVFELSDGMEVRFEVVLH